MRLANMQVARLSLILMYTAFIGGHWLVEQPLSSVLWWHPLVQALLQVNKARVKLIAALSDFTHPTTTTHTKFMMVALSSQLARIHISMQ